MNKFKFDMPEIEILWFDEEEILTASGGTGTGTDNGNNGTDGTNNTSVKVSSFGGDIQEVKNPKTLDVYGVTDVQIR